MGHVGLPSVPAIVLCGLFYCCLMLYFLIGRRYFRNYYYSSEGAYLLFSRIKLREGAAGLAKVKVITV